MRADRLLSILLLLQMSGRVTARELSERLEVSERTIHRDMEALCAAGIPVTADRGSGGGFGLSSAYQTNLTGLSMEEARALVIAQSSKLLADLGLSRASDTAFIKLLASLPTLARRDVDFTRERIHVDGAGWYEGAGEDVRFLPMLQDALWRERRVTVTYERGDRSRVERTVDPLGLVVKGRIWYLAAAVDGEVRSYRVSRVHAVEVLAAPAFRPPDFDLAAFWRNSVADFKSTVPRTPATIRVSPDLRERLRRTTLPEVVSECSASLDGWVIMEVRFDVESEACEWLARNARNAEAIAPESLRTAVTRYAEDIIRMYGRGRMVAD